MKSIKEIFNFTHTTVTTPD